MKRIQKLNQAQNQLKIKNLNVDQFSKFSNRSISPNDRSISPISPRFRKDREN